MAKSADQLFVVFAARVAEILRQRYGMDAASLLRVRQDRFTLEGLTRRAQDGPPEWYLMRAAPERLEWEGPDATAEVFVREYITAFEAASHRRSRPPII